MTFHLVHLLQSNCFDLRLVADHCEQWNSKCGGLHRPSRDFPCRLFYQLPQKLEAQVKPLVTRWSRLFLMRKAFGSNKEMENKSIQHNHRYCSTMFWERVRPSPLASHILNRQPICKKLHRSPIDYMNEKETDQMAGNYNGYNVLRQGRKINKAWNASQSIPA